MLGHNAIPHEVRVPPTKPAWRKRTKPPVDYTNDADFPPLSNSKKQPKPTEPKTTTIASASATSDTLKTIREEFNDRIEARERKLELKLTQSTNDAITEALEKFSDTISKLIKDSIAKALPKLVQQAVATLQADGYSLPPHLQQMQMGSPPYPASQQVPSNGDQAKPAPTNGADDLDADME